MTMAVIIMCLTCHCWKSLDNIWTQVVKLVYNLNIIEVQNLSSVWGSERDTQNLREIRQKKFLHVQQCDFL